MSIIASVDRILDLRRQRKPAVLPPRLAREGFLLSSDVHPRRVDLVVPPRLEQVQHLAELGHAGHARAGFGVGAEGHETQDHARGGGLGDEGHFGGLLLSCLGVWVG